MNEQAFRDYLGGLPDGLLVNWFLIYRKPPVYAYAGESQRLIAQELRARGHDVQDAA